MALTIIQLFSPVQLSVSGSPTTIITQSVPGGVLKNGRIRLVNTSASAVPVTLYAVPSADSPTAANCCLPAKSIAANDYIDIDVPTLKVNETLQGFAGTASVITVLEMGGVIYS
jgi:hypothetical protein